MATNTTLIHPPRFSRCATRSSASAGHPSWMMCVSGRIVSVSQCDRSRSTARVPLRLRCRLFEGQLVGALERIEAGGSLRSPRRALRRARCHVRGAVRGRPGVQSRTRDGCGAARLPARPRRAPGVRLTRRATSPATGAGADRGPRRGAPRPARRSPRCWWGTTGLVRSMTRWSESAEPRSSTASPRTDRSTKRVSALAAPPQSSEPCPCRGGAFAAARALRSRFTGAPSRRGAARRDRAGGRRPRRRRRRRSRPSSPRR